MDPDTDSSSDALSVLQLRIAKRADELVLGGTLITPLNLHCWYQAEFEILLGDKVPDDRQVD